MERFQPMTGGGGIYMYFEKQIGKKVMEEMNVKKVSFYSSVRYWKNSGPPRDG